MEIFVAKKRMKNDIALSCYVEGRRFNLILCQRGLSVKMYLEHICYFDDTCSEPCLSQSARINLITASCIPQLRTLIMAAVAGGLWNGAASEIYPVDWFRTWASPTVLLWVVRIRNPVATAGFFH